MIVFDLKCSEAHVFEAWFGSSADYETQRARGLIECPLCGDGDIGKAVMAPAVPAKGGTIDIGKLLAAQRKMEASSDYVGPGFAAEARAIHDGDAPPRSIYGEATRADALALARDGVPVAALPFTPLAKADA